MTGIDEIIRKADVLVEALPYIADFKGEIIVVKLGGSVQEDEQALRSILLDVAFMRVVGMLPIVVHGGGKAITRALGASGIETKFVQGLRVTDEPTLQVMEHVIKDEVNAQIVDFLNRDSVSAVPLPGDRVFFALKKTAKDPATGAPLDWGYVGNPVACDTGPVRELLHQKKIPVICPIGLGEDAHHYNINADTAAAAIAKALPARKLAYVSDVPGLLRDKDDPSSLIETLHIDDVDGLIRDGVIAGGMLPKIESCLEALRAGVRKIHLVDGRMPHSLLLEIFTQKGVGTQIVKQK